MQKSWPVTGSSPKTAGSQSVNSICILNLIFLIHLKGHCIEFKYYADGIHSGLTPPGNNS